MDYQQAAEAIIAESKLTQGIAEGLRKAHAAGAESVLKMAEEMIHLAGLQKVEGEEGNGDGDEG